MPSHPFIPVPNTASVEFIYANAGEHNENVIHVAKGSPFSLSDLQALRGVCDTWDDAYNQDMRSNQAALVRIRTRALDTNSSPTEDFALTTPRTGNLTGTPMPLNVCICAKIATGLAGRSFRGRWFCGNLSSTWVIDAGYTNLTVTGAIVTNLTHLLNDLASAGYTWVITSFMADGVWRDEGLNTDVTTITVVDTAFDSQRRRLPGRGHGP
jgi:hypothetical protein